MKRVEQFRHRRPSPSLYGLALLVLLIAQGQSRGALAQGQWETNGNNINNTNAGNVGVGTTTPTGPLEVQAPHSSITLSQADAAGKVTLQAAFGRDLHLSANAKWSGTAWERFDTNAPSWNFYVSSIADSAGIRRVAAGSGAIGWTDVFKITNTGSVGLGTLTPGVFLGDTGPTGTVVNIQSNPGYSMLRLTNSAVGTLEMGRVTFGSPSYTGTEKRTAVILSRSETASTADPSGNLVFYTSNAGALAERLRISPAGNVGVGTSAPGHKLDVQGGSVNAAGGLCIAGDCKTAWSQVGGSQWTTSGSNVHYSAGNVGVGTSAPTERLHVVGNISVTGNINAKYQDVAEWVPSTQSLAAGTVVVLDTARTNHVVASSAAYDTRVAGVVSAQPGLLLGERGEGKLMVATTGRVKVRVDATRGPVRVGDLLVTSGLEGVAMKSEPVAIGGRQMHLPGTLIGKALEPLEKGVGEILVLLSLQ